MISFKEYLAEINWKIPPKSGEHDDLKWDSEYGKAVRFIKKKYK